MHHLPHGNAPGVLEPIWVPYDGMLGPHAKAGQDQGTCVFHGVLCLRGRRLYLGTTRLNQQGIVHHPAHGKTPLGGQTVLSQVFIRDAFGV